MSKIRYNFKNCCKKRKTKKDDKKYCLLYTIRNKVMSFFFLIFDYKKVELLTIPNIECLAQIWIRYALMKLVIKYNEQKKESRCFIDGMIILWI